MAEVVLPLVAPGRDIDDDGREAVAVPDKDLEDCSTPEDNAEIEPQAGSESGREVQGTARTGRLQSGTQRCSAVE